MPSELSIPDYALFTCNIDRKHGRGIALYVSTWLKASLLMVNISPPESIWIILNLTGKDKLHIGCFYRSPTSTSANSENTNKQIKETVLNGDASHVLLLGYFNFLSINISELGHLEQTA